MKIGAVLYFEAMESAIRALKQEQCAECDKSCIKNCRRGQSFTAAATQLNVLIMKNRFPASVSQRYRPSAHITFPGG